MKTTSGIAGEITITDYPGLKGQCWNHHLPTIAPDEAFHRYEDGWRRIDKESLSSRELRLIEELIKVYGNGHFLGDCDRMTQNEHPGQEAIEEVLRALPAQFGDDTPHRKCRLADGIDFVYMAQAFRKIRLLMNTEGISTLTGTLELARAPHVDQYAIRIMVIAPKSKKAIKLKFALAV